jgi:hypothetical protein
MRRWHSALTSVAVRVAPQTREPQTPRDAWSDSRRLGHGGKLHQPHAVRVADDQRTSNFQRKPSLAAPADAGPCQQPRLIELARDLQQRLISTNQPSDRCWQIVPHLQVCVVGLTDHAVPMHRHNGRQYPGFVVCLKSQGLDQTPGCIAVRVGSASLELLNAVRTQAGSFGEFCCVNQRPVDTDAGVPKGREVRVTIRVGARAAYHRVLQRPLACPLARLLATVPQSGRRVDCRGRSP